MIEEASTYLFKATQNRFYFKTAKIVIPLKWTSKPEYKRLTIESYEKVSVEECTAKSHMCFLAVKHWALIVK